jgi:uncharacterized protein (DUF2126 family)
MRRSAKPNDYSAVSKTKEVISQLVTEGWELAFQWLLNHCGMPNNDTVDTLAKDALNVPSPEEPTTYEQAVVEIARKSAFLLVDVHKQNIKAKLGRQYWRRKFRMLYLEVSSLVTFASSLDMTTYSDT